MRELASMLALTTGMPRKQFIVRNLKLKEISSVDNPAQVGAVAVLTKRAEGETSDIIKSAAAVFAGGKPAHTVAEYEDGMFARAAELAKDMQCSPEQALSKCLTTDPTLRSLAHASEVARSSAYGVEVAKRHFAA